MAGRGLEKPKTALKLFQEIEDIARSMETRAQVMQGKLDALKGLIEPRCQDRALLEVPDA